MLVDVNFTDSGPVLPVPVVPKEMISVTQEGGKTKVRINSSSVGNIQECLRKAQYSLFEGWRAETESPATAFGSAIHSALEVFYSESILERKMPKFEDMEMMGYGHIVAGETDSILLRATRAFIDKAQVLVSLPEEDKRSIQNGVWTLWHYFQAYINDPYIAYEDESGPMIERDITFRLFEDSDLIIDYFGRIDVVLAHVHTGEILVCDHKTSSVVGTDFYNRLKPNHQYTGYLLGAKRALNLDTNSFLVNCLQVKQKPKTSRGAAPHFPRQITTRDEGDYQEFTDAVVKTTRDYLEARESAVWPVGHVNACAMYGGCSYLSVCSAPASMRGNILNAKYTKGVTR